MAQNRIPLTDAEKIDEIYRYFRKRRFSDILELCWKWTIRLCIVFSLGYIYSHPSFVSDLQLQKQLGSFISSVASPIIKDVVESQKNSMQPLR